MKTKRFQLVLIVLLVTLVCFGDTLPDLTVTSVVLLGDSITVDGSPFLVDITFDNVSAQVPSAGSVAWGNQGYFSEDRFFDVNDIPFFSSISFFELDQIFSVTYTAQGSLSSSSPQLPVPGDYYIIYSIDDAYMNQISGLPGIAELDENNNWLASDGTVTVLGQASDLPDLIISNLELFPNVIDPTHYSFTITNVGNAPVDLDGPTDEEHDNVSIQAYLSEDEIFNNAGDIAAGGSIIGLSPLGLLNPGESFTGTLPISAVNPGTHFYLTVQVDGNDYVEESDESNNTAAIRMGSATVMEVVLDIKPGSCPNPFNAKSQGALPVAVLGSEDFDVLEIDPNTICLEGVTPIRSSYEDTSTPVLDDVDCACTTDGPDGYMDLTLKFDRQQILAVLGEVQDGQEWLLHVTGFLYDGTEIEASDCVLFKNKIKN